MEIFKFISSCYLIYVIIMFITMLIDIFTKYKYGLAEKIYFPSLYINLVFFIIVVILITLTNA